MPSFSLESNFAVFKGALAKKKEAFIVDVQQSLERVSLAFIREIQQRMMNFRKDSPTTLRGTRVIGGMLKREWYQSAVIVRHTVQLKLWSATPYAPMHENAEKDGTPNSGIYQVPEHMATSHTTGRTWIVRAHRIHFPKRLRVGQAWEKNYPKAARKAIQESFARTLGKP